MTRMQSLCNLYKIVYYKYFGDKQFTIADWKLGIHPVVPHDKLIGQD